MLGAWGKIGGKENLLIDLSSEKAWAVFNVLQDTAMQSTNTWGHNLHSGQHGVTF